MARELYIYLHQFNLASVTLRLVLALFLGAFIGMERERTNNAAGMRTHMIVCIGAALTMLLSQYEVFIMYSRWTTIVNTYNIKIDVSRYSAQVINGIGFLGAGTVIVNRKQEVRGLTTASSLWASGCLGIVIGAGFYECVIFAFIMIFACNLFFSAISEKIISNSRNINVYVEYTRGTDLRTILLYIKEMGIVIYDVDIDKGHPKSGINPSAMLLMQLPHSENHNEVLKAIAELDCITQVDEV